MQVVTIILFTALILGFFFLFLLPGRWWPRRSPVERERAPHYRPNDDDDEPPVPPGSTMSLN
jgi:hypothetical protein